VRGQGLLVRQGSRTVTFTDLMPAAWLPREKKALLRWPVGPLQHRSPLAITLHCLVLRRFSAEQLTVAQPNPAQGNEAAR